jgi:hypothetical protein
MGLEVLHKQLLLAQALVLKEKRTPQLHDLVLHFAFWHLGTLNWDVVEKVRNGLSVMSTSDSLSESSRNVDDLELRATLNLVTHYQKSACCML